jgi:GrpB-like predicted nucleotidyltransferase (UPF0157 family)
MPTHPLWRAYETVDLETLDQVLVEGATRAPRTVAVVPHDPAWSARFDDLARLVRGALGDRVLALEHIGSTSVPGLAAKPVIDADLTVADSADEVAYVPDLESAGLRLRLREPGWEEHRMFTVPDRSINLHVFSPGAREPQRHLLFRDRLRSDDADRAAYGDLKARLAAEGFDDVMDYNNHKAALVYDIYERAFAADPRHEHDPVPRGDGPVPG